MTYKSFGFALAAVLFISVPSALAHAADLYVAPADATPAGNDSNDGSSGAPFLTIQHAIEQATNNDTITVEPGTYAENVVITGKDGLTIQGVGNTTLVKPASGIGFAVTNSNGLTIKNLKIHTTDPVPTGSGAHGIWVAGTPNGGTAVTGLTVQDDTIIVDGYSSGIYAEWIDTAPHSGWTIGGSGHGNTIEVNAGTGVTGDGMDLYDVSDSEISYNTITLTNPTDSTPVIWSSELSDLSNLKFEHNTVSGSTGSEVWIGTDFSAQAPDTTISTVSVANNTFSNWGARALKLNGSMSGINVAGNTFNMTADWPVIEGTAASSATGSSNTFNVSSPATIQKAIDSAFSGDTINVMSGTHSESIAQRTECGIEPASICIYKSLTLHGETGAILDGMGLGDGSAIALGRDGYTNPSNLAISDVTIEGLEIENYSNPGNNGGIGSGIIAWNTNASNITIQNNNIHDVGWDGVLVGSDNNTVQSGWTISGNTFSNVPEIAIELTNVTDSQVTDNTITGPATITSDTPDAGVGIEIAVRAHGGAVTGGTGVTVSGNQISGAFPAGSRAGINLLARAYSNPDSSATLDGVTVDGNSITGTGTRGISVASEQRLDDPAASVLSNLTIKNNTLTGNDTGVHFGFVVGNSGDDGTYSEITLSDKNNISGNTTTGVDNAVAGLTVDATNNWWGTKISSEIAALVSSGVDFDPWYTSAGKTTLSNAVVFPDESGTATLTSGTSQVVVTDAGQALIVAAGSVADATIDYSSLASGGSATVPGTNVTSSAANVEITAGTIISGSGWDGVLELPTTVAAAGTAPSGFSVGDVVIEVGAPGITLTFDKPVKLTLAGVRDAVGYKPVSSDTWTQITTRCTSTTDPGISSGECYASSGSSTVIWTYHFTTFGSLTQTRSGGGGGGGGVACASGTAWSPVTNSCVSTGQVLGTATPPATGQVLGAAAYNFSSDLSMGSSGTDVTELQKMLIAGGFDIPAITKGGSEYGYFGGQTLAAVIAYQKANGVSGTGYVGPLTRGVLNKGAGMVAGAATSAAASSVPGCIAGYKFSPTTGKACAATAAPASTGTTASPAVSTASANSTTFNFTKALTVGVRSAEVTELQKTLIAEGLLKIDAPTGYFGTLTKTAVQSFQEARGIVSTGYVGPLTRAELNKTPAAEVGQ